MSRSSGLIGVSPRRKSAFRERLPAVAAAVALLAAFVTAAALTRVDDHRQGPYPVGSIATSSPASRARDRASGTAALARAPLRFEVNGGQTDASVRFLAHGEGFNLFLTAAQAVLVLAGDDP